MFSADQKADLDLVLTAVRAIREHLSVEVAEEGIDDIVEEPPCGSQVTDAGGDVWERREGGWVLWWSARLAWDADEFGGAPDRWTQVRAHAPLRPTTDADRERVGLSVEPAPADDLPGEPVEALARAMRDAFNGLAPGRLTWDAQDKSCARWVPVARAAREHIAEEGSLAGELDAAVWHRQFEKEKARAEEAWAERDEWKRRFDGVHQQAVANAEAADGWRARHAALRADVDSLRRNPKSLTDVLMRAADALDRDDERTPQPDPDTVTLRRDDSDLEVEINSEKGKPSSCIVRHRGMTIFHGVSLDAIVTDRPLRAALGWGDEA